MSNGIRDKRRSAAGAAKLLLVTLAVASALLAAGAQGAAAAPNASPKPTSKCWLQVVNDWLKNNRVDGTYPIPCYSQAIQKLSNYPDIQNYSSAMDDIHRAMLDAIQKDRKSSSAGTAAPSNSGGSTSSGGSSGPPAGGSSGGGSSGGSSGASSSGSPSSGASSSSSPPSSAAKSAPAKAATSSSSRSAPKKTATKSPSVITHLFDTFGPSNAQSVPLPLLVLAGLAALLLLAAIGTWLARRLQARRMSPAPAPAPTRRENT